MTQPGTLTLWNDPFLREVRRHFPGRALPSVADAQAAALRLLGDG